MRYWKIIVLAESVHIPPIYPTYGGMNSTYQYRMSKNCSQLRSEDQELSKICDDAKMRASCRRDLLNIQQQQRVILTL